MLASRVVLIGTSLILLWGGASGLQARMAPNRTSQDARIEALEKRVRQLESMVERLAAGRAQTATSPTEITPALFTTETRPESLSPARSDRHPLPQELLPNLGKIGAVATLTTGFNAGAFGLHGGSYLGGSVQLPLALVPGGRLSYEFSAGLAQSSRSLPTTSNVAQIANLAVLTALRPNESGTNLSESLNGSGGAPFAVTQKADWRAQTVQIVPFALHYSLTRLDRYHLRPYVVAGLGAYVTTSRQTAATGLRSDATLTTETKQSVASLFGQAPFTGPLIGGQITSSNQLQASGLPSGQGGADLGIHTGGGLEWLFPSGLSLSFDARLNVIPSGTDYPTFAARWGWRF